MRLPPVPRLTTSCVGGRGGVAGQGLAEVASLRAVSGDPVMEAGLVVAWGADWRALAA